MADINSDGQDWYGSSLLLLEFGYFTSPVFLMPPLFKHTLFSKFTAVLKISEEMS